MPRLSAFLVAIIPPLVAHATIYPRQDVSAVGAVMSTTTSSINWWPYPAGGIITSTTSTSFLLPTLVPLTPTPMSSSPQVPITSSPPLKPSTLRYTSSASLLHTTSSATSSVPTPSPDPQSFLRPVSTPHNSLWLVPVCFLLGAIIGCAIGWLAWRHFGGKRDDMAVSYIPERYAWAYKHETEDEHADTDKNVEHRDGQEYLSSGNVPAYLLEQKSRRMSSYASTSGARTWVEQTRKRSGVVQINEGSNQDYEKDVRSPLLTQVSRSEELQDLKPLPASPIPSPYSYGDDDDELPCENIRHKSVRRRIWERLGFAEGDLGRKNSKLHEGEGRHTWSAGGTQERQDVGRSLSFWGRRKSMKEGRVERWVRQVMGLEEGDVPPEPAPQQEVPMESLSIDYGEISPHFGTPELVLSTLRRVSPSAWHSPDSNADLTTVFAFDEKFSKPYPPASRHLNATVVPHPATIRSGRRSLGHVDLRSRGVSLQDHGPVSGSVSDSLRTIMRTSSPVKNAFPLRSTTTARSNPSQRTISSPTPPSPSSISRYSAMSSYVPALSTLNRSPTRTPTRSNASRDLRTTLTRAVPSRLTSPVSTVIRSDNTPPTCPSPNYDSQTRPPFQQRFTSDLPAGPSFVLSPPLQSALCFDEAPGPARMPTSTNGTKITSSCRAHKHFAKRVSASGSTPPNARTSATPPCSSYRPTERMPVPPPKPLSPKERYLARQNANARVGMILSRSYSSRNFEERPVSPTMFGAVIDEGLESRGSEEGHSEKRDTLTFGEGREGIEQRLDRLRNH